MKIELFLILIFATSDISVVRNFRTTDTGSNNLCKKGTSSNREVSYPKFQLLQKLHILKLSVELYEISVIPILEHTAIIDKSKNRNEKYQVDKKEGI